MEKTNVSTNGSDSTKLKKEFANYDVVKMSFNAGGIERIYTFDKDNVEKLNDATKRLILIGARNVVIDSCASMTKKDGFTDEQRKTKMTQTMEDLNNGKFSDRKSTEKPVVTIGQLNAITDIAQLKALRDLITMGTLANVKLTPAQLEILEKSDNENPDNENPDNE